jgi:hypothetical protein
MDERALMESPVKCAVNDGIHETTSRVNRFLPLRIDLFPYVSPLVMETFRNNFTRFERWYFREIFAS